MQSKKPTEKPDPSTSTTKTPDKTTTTKKTGGGDNGGDPGSKPENESRMIKAEDDYNRLHRIAKRFVPMLANA